MKTLIDLYTEQKKYSHRRTIAKSWYQFHLGCYYPDRLKDILGMKVPQLREEWITLLRADRDGIKEKVADFLWENGIIPPETQV